MVKMNLEVLLQTVTLSCFLRWEGVWDLGGWTVEISKPLSGAGVTPFTPISCLG